MKHLMYDNLSDRQFEVLSVIVRLYVSSAHPVSSRQLAKTMGKQLSPATLRNTMADLEEMGFLKQPHTSAGRIPTELAYRLYVDKMMKHSEVQLLPRERQSFREQLDLESSPSSLLTQTSSRLSDATGFVSFITVPEFSKAVFKHMEFIHLHSHTVLVIFVSDSGLVHQRVVQTEKDVTQDELHRMSRFVNENFALLPLSSLRERILDTMRQDKLLYDQLMAQALDLANRAIQAESLVNPSIKVEGTANILGQPEFANNADRMLEIYRAFEQKSKLLNLLNSCVEEGSVVVVIGSELDIPEIRDFTLVTSSYKYGARSLGSVGVLGPMRMDYPKIAAWVSFAGQTLSEMISGKEDPGVE